MESLRISHGFQWYWGGGPISLFVYIIITFYSQKTELFFVLFSNYSWCCIDKVCYILYQWLNLFWFEHCENTASLCIYNIVRLSLTVYTYGNICYTDLRWFIKELIHCIVWFDNLGYTRLNTTIYNQPCHPRHTERSKLIIRSCERLDIVHL